MQELSRSVKCSVPLPDTTKHLIQYSEKYLRVDPSYIATVNVAEDKEKAVNNNYELISLRGQTGGGMTDLQIRTSKTTTQIANKLRNVEYSEENVRSNIQALYDAMEEKIPPIQQPKQPTKAARSPGRQRRCRRPMAC